jgi:hypothetical protein
MTTKRKPAAGTVSVEIGGKTYRADYAVFSDVAPMITVKGLDELAGRVRTTQLGNSPAEGLARIMVHEFVADMRRGL